MKRYLITAVVVFVCGFIPLAGWFFTLLHGVLESHKSFNYFDYLFIGAVLFAIEVILTAGSKLGGSSNGSDSSPSHPSGRDDESDQDIT